MFSWWRLCFSGAIIPYIVYEQFHFFFFCFLISLFSVSSTSLFPFFDFTFLFPCFLSSPLSPSSIFSCLVRWLRGMMWRREQEGRVWGGGNKPKDESGARQWNPHLSPLSLSLFRHRRVWWWGWQQKKQEVLRTHKSSHLFLFFFQRRSTVKCM